MMLSIPVRFLFLTFAALWVNLAVAAEIPAARPHPLVWEATELSAAAKPGEKEVKFEFRVTNKSATPVEVVQVSPSCGCTVAELPSTPWVIAPGAKGAFTAVVDIQGKHGKLSKSLNVHSDAGSQILTMVIDVPETEEGRRERNQQLAFIDRQAVFRGDCASCHVRPAIGRIGEELYEVACAICHQSSQRASMVPDLAIARGPRDAAFWERWISEGKDRSLMPAFSSKHGGPLTAEQIASLVQYAIKRFPSAPPTE